MFNLINKQLIMLTLVVFLLSGCSVQNKLRWVDDKLGKIFFSEIEQKNDIASSTKKVDFKKLTKEQKEKIDNWLKQNNFNRYGDDINTRYASGTPLLGDSINKNLDRFEYIIEKIPDILNKIKN